MESVARLFAASAQLQRERPKMPQGFDLARPHPAHFGLSSFAPQDEVVEVLLRAETHLSAGSLRDVLHVANLMRSCYDARDDSTRMKAVTELANWLDPLPEIERHALAIQVVSWCSGQWRWERPFFALAAEMIDRLPERCYDQEDYRAYWRNQLSASCPPFAEYLTSADRVF